MENSDTKFDRNYLRSIFKIDVRINYFLRSTCWKCGHEIILIYVEEKNTGKNLKGFRCENCGRIDIEYYNKYDA